MRKAWVLILSCLIALPLLGGLGAVSVSEAVGRGRVAGPSARALPAETGPAVVRPTVTKIALRKGYSASSWGRAGIRTDRRSTAPFATLGVTWRGRSVAADVEIDVRTRTRTKARARGNWSDWTHLHADAGDDPVAAGAVRGGTDPLYVGASDGVQVRVEVESGRLPAGIRLELVDPGRSEHDLVAASTPPGAWNGSAAADPGVLSRAQWGADESRVRCAPEYAATVKAAIVHHTAGSNGYSAYEVPGILRGDYAYHLSRGWCDIGYNVLVDRFGRLWEGRAGGLDQAVIGAHAGGFNTATFGVSMIGNYDLVRPSQASITAVARVVAWKLGRYHRDPRGRTQLVSAGGGTARHPAGARVDLPVVMGHRDTGYTACPGAYLYPALGQIRSRATRFMQAGLINPSTPQRTVEQGSVLSLTARAMRRQRWRLDVTAGCNGGLVARIRGSAAARREIVATWNGRLADGSPARPGSYRLTLRSSSATGTAVPVTSTVLIVPPPQPVQPAAAARSGQGHYVAVAPTRLHDSRDGVGLGPGGYARIPVLGQAGVPAGGVTAVLLNLTVSCASADTALTVFPTGRPSSRPVGTVPAGATRSMLVTSRIGADGSVSVRNARGVGELTVDLVGYFTDRSGAGEQVRAVEPIRILDTRSAGGPLRDGQTRTLTLPDTVAGLGVARIDAVVLDVSALAPRGTGSLRLGSTDVPALNYRRGETIDNLAVVPVSRGRFTLSGGGAPTGVIMDVRAVIGSGVGGTLTALKPTLLTDTRLSPRTPKKLTVTGTGTGVPEDASAVLVVLTAVESQSATALNTYPWGTSAAGTAALRAVPGESRANQVFVPVGSSGAIALFSGAQARVRVDLVGYVR